MSMGHRVRLFFSNQITLTILGVMIIAHIIMLFFYLQESTLNRRALHRDSAVQKIVNAIYLIEATPRLNRRKAVAAIEDSDFKVTLSAVPETKLRFSTLSYWKIAQTLRKNPGSFNISVDVDDGQWINIHATLSRHEVTRQLVLLAVEFFVFICLFFSAWSIFRFTMPLKRFKSAAEQLGIDLNTPPLDIYGPPIVREAALAINQMQNRIQTLVRARTQMLAAISHDLRTPITRLKLRAHMLGDSSVTESFVQDLDEMEVMIEEVLSFSRDNAIKESVSHFDLVSFLVSICEEYSDQGENIEFKASENQLPYWGRRVALKRVFTNVINNAVRVSSRVNVTMHKSGHSILIAITDNGPGMPEDELEQVFEPFYRTEQSRSRDTGGVGLGLAVVRNVLRQHHGRVTLRNQRPHGLQVKIWLSQKALKSKLNAL